MQAKKIAKWGLALTSTLVLGGVVAPVGGQLLNAPSVVYAQEKTATANVVSYHPSGVLGQYQDIIPLGGSKTYTAPVFDGWEVYAAGAYSANFSWTVKGVDSVTLPEGFTEESVLVEFHYKPMQIRPTEQPSDQPVEKTAEVPAEQPVETPAEQPVEKPVETPAEQPLSVTFRFVDSDGNTIYPDSVWSVAPGGTPAINDAPVIEGYELVDSSQAVVLVSYEQAKERDTYIVEYHKVAPPTDTPVEQPVATTDKKKVDNSTPSTNTVKPEEGSQTTAKTLPKTGDSSSMLLVLGGVLSGLSGLGLAATSRKKY
ncbi:TPA: LPXTG cell wall anchor domain-containing protein [Streptococcus suis]